MWKSCFNNDQSPTSLSIVLMSLCVLCSVVTMLVCVCPFASNFGVGMPRWIVPYKKCTKLVVSCAEATVVGQPVDSWHNLGRTNWTPLVVFVWTMDWTCSLHLRARQAIHNQYKHFKGKQCKGKQCCLPQDAKHPLPGSQWTRNDSLQTFLISCQVGSSEIRCC